jgi:hypothetical protein
MLGKTLGCKEAGRLYRGRKKEPISHLNMCRAEHRGNCPNSLTYTLDHQPDIGI